MVLDLSLDPALLRWGAFALTWKTIFATLAVLLGVWIARLAAARLILSTAVAGRITCWALLGGALGSRLVHVLAHLPYYAAEPYAILSVGDGSGSLAGALLGGLVALSFLARHNNAAIVSLLRAAVPGLLVGSALYAVGDLLTGAAWGRPTACDWGVIYWHPDALLPPDLLSTPLHPYPLYQIMFAVLLLAASSLRSPMTSAYAVGLLGVYALGSGVLSSFSGSTPLLDQLLLIAIGVAACAWWVLLRYNWSQTGALRREVR